jgi:rhamnogalacturonyl hydrolase YesR
LRKALVVILILLLIIQIFVAQTKSEPTETPLQVAEKAGTWVVTQAIPECGGYKWEWGGARGLIAYQSIVTCGAAGVGTFFLKLYEKTGNSTFLDYAKGAAQWVICEAIPSAGGYYWLSPDDDMPSGWRLSPNVAGIGDFLLTMYKTIGNTTYLAYAERAAIWLIAMAEYESGGCFIPYNPPGKYGSQAAHGISPGREAYTVTFLLHLYEETANTTYLTYVKGMANWLISGPDIRKENGGYKWENDRPYYVIGGFPINTAAQIAVFFYESYRICGNETYLQYANGAVQWILSQAVVEGDMVKWPSRQGASDYPIIIGDKLLHGVSVVGDVLLLGYSVTGNATYLEYAKKHANWITGQGTPEVGGYKFSNAYVNALIYRFLMELYNIVEEIAYQEYANGVLAWIVNNATTIDGGYKWRTYEYYPYFPAWFAIGASGVGYHLISAPEYTVLEYTLTITTTTGGTTDPTLGTYIYDENSTAQITAIPNAGYKFDYWVSDGSPAGSANPINILMTQNHTLEAVFTQITYQLKIETTTGGTTTPTPGTYTYVTGSSIQVTANPNTNYVLDHWELDGSNVGSANPYTVTMNQNHTLKAVFVYSPPTPPLSASISPLSASINIGQSITFTSTITGGTSPYKYQWYLNDNLISGATSTSWTFTPTTSGIYYVYLKVTDAHGNTTQSQTARISAATIPVGGYSYPISGHTTTTPLTFYLVLTTIIASVFITIKRKTLKRKGHS